MSIVVERDCSRRAPARIVEHDEIEARERAHRLGVPAVATRERRTGARTR
jgi:hypothetical protein